MFYSCQKKYTSIEIFASMSRSVIHNVPQFSFRRLMNGGILINNATMEAVSLGLSPSHFLIHVEYRKIGTVDVLTEVIKVLRGHILRRIMHQVINKTNVHNIKAFFENDANTILKYFCKSEDEFQFFFKDNKKALLAQRSKDCLRRIASKKVCTTLTNT